MAQKPHATTATRLGDRCAPWSLATCGCHSVWRDAVYRATLARAGQGATSGSSRLDGASTGSETHPTHRAGDRTTRAYDPAVAQGPQCVGRVRRGGNPTGDGCPKGRTMPVDPHDQPDSPTSGRLGWSQTNASDAAAERLVSARCRDREGRTGQLRHHRRLGDSRRAALDGIYGDFAAWGPACRFARTTNFRKKHVGSTRGTLAGSGASGLCPIRQRQPLHGTASTLRRHRPCHPSLLESGSDSRVRGAHRTRFPGSDREFQRSLASEGLVAIRASFAAWFENTIGQLHCCRPKPRRRPDRSRAAATSVPQTLAAEPATTPRRQDHLPPTHQRQRPCQRSGACLPGRSALAASSRSRRGRPRCEPTSRLRPAKTQTDRSTAAEGHPLHPSMQEIQRVTSMY